MKNSQTKTAPTHHHRHRPHHRRSKPSGEDWDQAAVLIDGFDETDPAAEEALLDDVTHHHRRSDAD
jgi:hypothetical protein